MGFPQIGLEAIFKDADFNKAMKGYKDSINQASKETADAGDSMGASLSKAVSAIGGITLAAGAVVVTGLVAAFTAIGSAAFKAGETVDESMDRIAIATGAVGPELDKLQEEYLQVLKNTVSTADQVGIAVAEVTRRFETTGETTVKLSGQFLDMSRMLGTDLKTTIGDVSMAMKAFNVPTEETSEILDMLFVASQKSGVELGALLGAVKTYAQPMKALGYTFKGSTALIAKWTANGIDAGKMIAAMRIGISNMIDPAKDAEEVMSNMADVGPDIKDKFGEAIKAIENATSSTEAMNIGLQLFGTRGAVDLVTAIREGKLSIDDFALAMDNSTGAIEKTFRTIKDWPDLKQLIKNNFIVALEPLGTKLWEIAGIAAEKFLPIFTDKIVPFFNDHVMPVFSAVVDALGKLIEGDWQGALGAILPPDVGQRFTDFIALVDTIGAAVKNTFTDLFSTTSWEDIPAQFDAATGRMGEASPGLKTKLYSLGKQIGAWVGEGLLTLVEEAGKLVTGFTDWLESGGLDQLWKIGVSVGETIVDAIEALIGISQSSTTNAITNMLVAAVGKVSIGAGTAFATVFTGIWVGAIESIFGSTEMTAAARNVIGDYFAIMLTPGVVAKAVVDKVGTDMKNADAELKPTFKETAVSMWGSFIDGLQFGWDQISSNWTITSDNFAKLITGGDQDGAQLSGLINTWISNALANVGGGIMSVLSPIGAGIAGVATAVLETLGGIATAIYNWLSGIGTTVGYWNSVILAVITLPYVKAYEWLQTWVPDVISWIRNAWDSLGQVIYDNAGIVINAVAAPFITAYNGFVVWGEQALEWIRETWQGISEQISEFSEVLWEVIKQPWADAWNTLVQWATDIWGWITETWTTITSKIGENNTAVSNSIKQPFDDAWTAIKGIAQDIIDLFANIKIHIPLPKFSLSWSAEDISPLFPGVKWPKFDVTWAQNGLSGLFNSPTLIGVGEAGPEYVNVMPARGSEPGRQSAAMGSMGWGGGNEYHYHLHIISSAPEENLMADYQVLSSMGAALQ